MDASPLTYRLTSLFSKNIGALANSKVALLILGSLFSSTLFLYRKQVKNRKTTTTNNLETPLQCPPRTRQDMAAILMGKDGPKKMLQLRMDMGVPDFEFPTLLVFPRLFVTTNYQNARHILEHKSSLKPVMPFDDFLQNTTHNGMNFISANGQRWRHVRKSTAAAFSSQNVKLMVVAISQIVDKWVEDVLHLDEDKHESSSLSLSSSDLENTADGPVRHIHILDEMNRITANVISKVAFDYDISDEERDAFLQDLLTCWQTFGVGATGNLKKKIRLTRWMYSDIRAAKKAAKRLFEFCGKMATSYRAKDEKQPHKLIHMILDDEEYNDDSERFRDMIAITIAGFDTTANALSFTLLELAKNEEEQTKLRDTLRKCKSMDEAHNCPQLKNIVREILRLYPGVATGSFREAHSDIVLPATQKVIPSGSFIITPYYAIQRDPDMFESPNSFLPSRWEDASKEQNMSLLTFSFGMRNCLGQALAYAEMYEILAKLVPKFEFGVVNEGEACNVVLFKPVGTILSVKKAL